MYLILIGAVMIALKFFEVKHIADLSWWWVLSPLFLAIAYFEIIEPMLGLDKKKAHDENDKFLKKRKEERIKIVNKRK